MPVTENVVSSDHRIVRTSSKGMCLYFFANARRNCVYLSVNNGGFFCNDTIPKGASRAAFNQRSTLLRETPVSCAISLLANPVLLN
ncbi:hypothetical protein E2C01_073450 [Portunus trituberculatus]|uniref:Uncharacterized protein n=1 Tax=Portunus trituberculatus TaxID=210409 RepID=A0A5B7I0P9_PORTR|nr:hypothetical protein [Portunus trituberculatus]